MSSFSASLSFYEGFRQMKRNGLARWINIVLAYTRRPSLEGTGFSGKKELRDFWHMSWHRCQCVHLSFSVNTSPFISVPRVYLGPRGTREQGSGENYVTRNFML